VVRQVCTIKGGEWYDRFVLLREGSRTTVCTIKGREWYDRFVLLREGSGTTGLYY
jgi:hypothetical protein